MICSNEHDPNDCTIFFKAKLINNAFTYFKLIQSSDANSSTLNAGEIIEFTSLSEKEDPLLDQPFQTYVFDNGKSLKFFEDLQKFVYNDGKNTYPFRLSYKHYRSYQESGQKSGAYIFRPDNYTINRSLLYSLPRFAKVFTGNNLIQISVIFFF